MTVNCLLPLSNLKKADLSGLNIQDSFTKEVIEIWSTLIHDWETQHTSAMHPFGTTHKNRKQANLLS